MMEKLKEKVLEIFDRYSWREDIERELQNIGFELWALIDDNEDEQIWAYDKGTPNGQILVLINWMDGFAWLYEKTERINLRR